jgi:predicted DCC family thiol-disulfide oxidoreductase YuxK
MQRYLLFDAGCSTCSELAVTVKEAAGANLETVSLRSERARAWLDRVFPKGWTYAPYLVTVQGAKVNAWTGPQLGLRLARLLGPRKAWRVWSVAQRGGMAWAPVERDQNHPGTR